MDQHQFAGNITDCEDVPAVGLWAVVGRVEPIRGQFEANFIGFEHIYDRFATAGDEHAVSTVGRLYPVLNLDPDGDTVIRPFPLGHLSQTLKSTLRSLTRSRTMFEICPRKCGECHRESQRLSYQPRASQTSSRVQPNIARTIDDDFVQDSISPECIARRAPGR